MAFTSYTPSHNLKIGRLKGVSGSGIVIRNVTLSGAGKNLIARLNSGIADLTFENCDISSSGTTCTGLIGVNNGSIKNCNFKNITITPLSSNIDEVGIIAHQNGGTLSNITLDTVKVNAYASKITGIDYVGALCGKITDGSTLSNISGINIDVSGATTVGGIAGQIYITDASDVTLTNIVVTSNGNYVGGFVGRLGTDTNGRSGKVNNINIIGTPIYDSNGVIIDSTTKVTTTSGSYVGGIAGSNYHQSGETFSTSEFSSVIRSKFCSNSSFLSIFITFSPF